MKRIVCIAVFAMVLICSAVLMQDKAYAYTGEGTEDSPTEISSVDDYNTYVGATWDGTRIFAKLKKDITVSYSLCADFEGVTGAGEFHGVFDGNGHTVTLQSEIPIGFCDKVGSDGVIKNLNISFQIVGSVDVTYVGAIAGVNKGTIENCSATGNDVFGQVEVGGLVGLNDGGKIDQCTMTINDGIFTTRGDVTDAGGLVGCNRGSITRSVAKGAGTIYIPSKPGYAGGIAGANSANVKENKRGIIQSCIVEGSLQVQGYYNDHIGGIAGYNSSYSKGISDCLVFGSVVANGNGQAYDVGGICGYADHKEVQNCFYNSNGGLVGGTAGSYKNIIIGRYNLDADEISNSRSNYWNADKIGGSDDLGTGLKDIWWLDNQGKVTLPAAIAAEDGLLCAGRSFYYRGKTVTLGYSGSLQTGQTVVYYLNGKKLDGNTIEMPKQDSVVTAQVVQSVDVAAVTLSNTSYNYDGSAHNPTAQYSGKTFTQGTDYTIEYYTTGSNSARVDNCVNAGTYDAVISGIGNYGGDKTIQFTINRVDSQMTQSPAAKELTYNGNAQELLTAGKVTGGTMLYKLEGDSDYSDAVPTGTDAKKYKVYYMVQGDGNHNDGPAGGPIEVEIKKADISVTKEPAAKDLTYNGNAQELLTAGKVTGGTVLYKLEEDSDYSEAVPTGTNAGDYKVCYMVQEDKNHNDSEAGGTIEVKIKKAKSKVTTKPKAKTVNYKNAKQKLIVGGKASGGTMMYRTSKTKYSKSIPTAKQVGKYGIYYKVVGDANHEDCTEAGPLKAQIKPYGTTLAAVSPKGSRGLVIGWNQIHGAEGYDIFFNKCSKKKCKLIKTIKGSKKTSYTFKKLKQHTAYKAYVKAWVMKDGNKKYIAKTPAMHTYTSNGSKKYTIPKSVSVNVKSKKLKVNKTYKIKATVKPLEKGKILMAKGHAPATRYMSSNKKIATVDKNGKVVAKKRGTAKIYVYAVNGKYKTVLITVK